MFFSLVVVLLAVRLSNFSTGISDSRGPDHLFPPPLPASVTSVCFQPGSAFTMFTLRGELKQRCMNHIAVNRCSLLIALIISGDIHPHPGPALGDGIFPCGLCELKCGWDVSEDSKGGAICCDECSMWYHRDCLEMNRSEYIRRGRKSASYRCLRCNTYAVDSFTFHGYNLPTSNSFSVLQGMGDDSVFYADRSAVQSPASDFIPGAFSSPMLSGNTDGKSSGFSSSLGGQSLPNPNGKVRILTLNANSAKGKPAEIAAITELIKPDIIVMSETKLDKSVLNSEFLPSNFQGNVIRKDRTLKGGGVLIAHRQGLVANPVSCKGIKSDCEMVFSRVSMAHGQPPLYVGGYYRSQIDNTPNSSLDGLETALEQVTNLVGNSKATVHLSGDFNCPDVDWENTRVKQGCKIVSVSEKLIKVTAENGLKQMQKESTRLNSLLDLVFTNNVSSISSVETAPGISTVNKHVAVVTDLNLKAEISRSAPHKIHLWNKVNWEPSEVRRKHSRISSLLTLMANLWTTNGNPLRSL